ncbi:MAG TPA: hypothetical protein VNY82_00740, partial [Steroidobacteraceae bacterium]|nr:hypothetical protein [Steroidobacteraceae bacterium]
VPILAFAYSPCGPGVYEAWLTDQLPQHAALSPERNPHHRLWLKRLRAHELNYGVPGSAL